MDDVLAERLESMAQELGEVREIRAELKNLRRLVEALTGMVEGLTATQRRQDGNLEQEAISDEHQAPEDAGEPDTADDQPVPETAEFTPSAL
jgi:hypothetical protein